MSLVVQIDAGIATVTIDREERMNAMTQEMKADFRDAFSRFRDDPAVRAVILRGKGKAFCAGSDVGTMGDMTIAGGRRRLQLAHDMIKGIAHLEKPVIAAVGGTAVGFGWSLALACDFILVTPAARFGQVFRKIGLAPDGGAVFLLTQYVGMLRAKELTMSGRFVLGEEAYRLGLATELVAQEALDQRAREIATDMAGAAGLALGMTKRLFTAAAGSDLDRFLEVEAHVQNQLAQTADHREGVRAFAEKRKPRFTGG